MPLEMPMESLPGTSKPEAIHGYPYVKLVVKKIRMQVFLGAFHDFQNVCAAS
jgi:hypothetical protein